MNKAFTHEAMFNHYVMMFDKYGRESYATLAMLYLFFILAEVDKT